MNPAVVAAVIATSVSLLTLVVSVVAQTFGIRKTSSGTEETLKQLDRTLAEQRDRTLNERFATAADRLGSDKPSAVQLAGVYAMAGLADDWKENRQACVDVLCAYLRMPYEPDPGQDVPGRLAFRASREVRHTVIRVITARLKDGAAVSWRGLNFDFTGAVFDGGDFAGAEFSGGTVSFTGAEFSGGEVYFTGAEFSGGTVSLASAKFAGGEVYFTSAEFSGATVYFTGAEFSGATVDFNAATFSGGEVYFTSANFSGGTVDFTLAAFSGSMVGFRATFSGGAVNFEAAEFSGGEVRFNIAAFSGGTVGFTRARFCGGAVGFPGAEFSGATVDFSSPGDWSFPPEFPWKGTPPPGVILSREDQSQA